MKKIIIIVLLIAGQVSQAIDITLESSDGETFKVAQEQVEKSVTLKNMLEDLKGSDFSKDSIPLPTIDGDTLRAIVDCLKNPESVDRIVRDLDKDKLDKFTRAISYLDIPEMYKKIPAICWLSKQLEQREPKISMGSVDSALVSDKGYKSIYAESRDTTVCTWYPARLESLNNLNIDQLDLITRIYEEAQKNKQLNLVQNPADTLKNAAQRKIDTAIFGGLPKDVKTALKEFVVLPEIKK